MTQINSRCKQFPENNFAGLQKQVGLCGWTFDKMSAITIVRRYKCWEVRESPRDPNSSLFIRQEGFLQICGSTDLREMLIISDQISSLKVYQLTCNCQYCTSFFYESMTDSRVTTEMFMNAVNIIFSTLSKFNYEMQSTSSMQNHDGSNSVTWIWIRKPK